VNANRVSEIIVVPHLDNAIGCFTHASWADTGFGESRAVQASSIRHFRNNARYNCCRKYLPIHSYAS
jgi:hypothetical protein